MICGCPLNGRTKLCPTFVSISSPILLVLLPLHPLLFRVETLAMMM